MDAFAVRGHLDGLQGDYIVGWAIGPQGRTCEIVVSDNEDRIIAEGLASVERPDLAVVGKGRSNFAFRIPIPALDRAQLLHVMADGVELQNSPQRVGPDIFDGYVTVARGGVVGWVTERVSGFAPPLITLTDQTGRVVVDCQSAIDDTIGDGLFSPARFSADLDDRCFGQGELRLTAFANRTKFAETSCHLPLLGFLETISAGRCSGWLLAPGALHRSFTFDIHRDGEEPIAVTCDDERLDVRDAYPGSRRPGFNVTLPPARHADPLAFTTLSFRFPGSDRELFDGPYVLGNRPELVSAARRASRLAVGAMSHLLSGPEQAVMQAALGDFISRARQTDRLVFGKQPVSRRASLRTRLTIIVPIYRGIDITKACIASVLASRSAEEDRIVLVNDRSPDSGMAAMLARFAGVPNLFILANETNLGFIGSVNRGLSFAAEGDVLLLNSDTRIFPGGLSELCRVAHASPDIGTVTAMSSNATIFSYPHPTLRGVDLPDIGWADLADIALHQNAGRCIDVPTGHGFCLLIKRAVLDRVGVLDEAFGRGYGEENDFCARAADLGYRNVAAPGVLVEHRESISFTGDKSALLAANLRILEGRYPEYTPIIMEAERRDDLRSGRWALDAARLARAAGAGTRFALVVRNGLGGGTGQAIADIEATVGYGKRTKIALSCRADGFMELTIAAPAMFAVFAPDETAQLMELLSAARIDLVVVHQVLGFPARFITELRDWLRERHGVFYAHDYYALCPRVTMIDAAGQFCDVASPGVCTRCLALGGAHDSSRLDDLTPEEHRDVFADFLAAFAHVVVPSQSAAGYLGRVFPDRAFDVVPHPSPPIAFPAGPRPQRGEEVVLFGAIGPHKGSAKLLEIAQLARLTHPSLRFRVIGFTDRDDEFRRLGNVIITGPYESSDLDELVRASRGRLALFLSGWPETYSYTLTEAVRLGFIPVVPNIGAPAERVRATQFGAIFSFPIIASEVLRHIADLGAGLAEAFSPDVRPGAFEPGEGPVLRTKALLLGEDFVRDRGSPYSEQPVAR